MKLRDLSLLLTVAGAGLAVDAGAAPTPTPTPAPTPTATAVATATPAPTPNYNGNQQQQYINTAREAFVAQRTTKSQPFLDAYNALEAAGGVSGKGLKTREDITARRELVAKTIAANDAYTEFVKTQEDAYRAELAKTPLIKEDVDVNVKLFGEHANTAGTVKLRQTQTETLKITDEILAALDKRFGAWSVSEAGRISFKKSADLKAMNALYKRYTDKVTELQAEQKELLPTPSPSPTASPASSVPGAAPTASVVPTPAGVSPTASPTASVKK